MLAKNNTNGFTIQLANVDLAQDNHIILIGIYASRLTLELC